MSAQSPFSIRNLIRLLSGRLPGQVVIQTTDRCNARCPQCEMRVQNKFQRSTLPVDTIKRILDAAAERGVQAVSFTGGEPFLHQQDLTALIRHAAQAGIPYIRTGTNGFMFLGADKPCFEDKVKAFAEQLASTELYTFWISLDSVDPATHERMRGLPGVMRGIERAVEILHDHGVYPSANLGVNRNLGGDYRGSVIDPHGEAYDPEQHQEYFRDAFDRFYRRVVELGFTIVNMCYPMSLPTGEPGAAETPTDLTAVYGAASSDVIVDFSSAEKLALFRALLETAPRFRSQVRIFTPLTSVLALIRQYSEANPTAYGCRGGIDFFFVDAAAGDTFPCGFRGQENLGKYWDIETSDVDRHRNCQECDWECFRDPSELAGPALGSLFHPWRSLGKLLSDAEYRRSWINDLRYYQASNYFNGRTPPDHRLLGKFLHQSA